MLPKKLQHYRLRTYALRRRLAAHPPGSAEFEQARLDAHALRLEFRAALRRSRHGYPCQIETEQGTRTLH